MNHRYKKQARKILKFIFYLVYFAGTMKSTVTSKVVFRINYILNSLNLLQSLSNKYIITKYHI